MTTGKITGVAYLVDPAAHRQIPPPPGASLVAIADAWAPSLVVEGASFIAWVCADPGGDRGGGSWFQSDVDLRPYFHTGDPVEIDPYQGLIRHLREGYAFPVRAVR